MRAPAPRRPLLGAGTREALTLWVSTRVVLIAFSVLATWLLDLAAAGRGRGGGTHLTGSTAWFLERFTWWDSFHFLRIADVGYLPPGLPCCDQAFQPGYPIAIAAVGPLTGGDLALAGFLVSVVLSAVAAMGLHRLAERVAGEGAGRTAVVLLAVAPYGFFLTAVYSEALFLALAVWAWLAGMRHRWWLAGVLAGAATAVRVNGLFLALGLAVMLLVQLRSEGRWPFGRGALASVRPALPLAIPGLTYAAWTTYLWYRTGSFDAWQQAQRLGWGREVAAPWTGLGDGVTSLLAARAPSIVISRFADLFFAVLGVVLCAVLLRRRRWAEAAYMLPSVGVLVCSTTLISTPRYSVLWLPAFLLLAEAASRRPRLVPALTLLGVPWLALVTLSFSAHLWTA